MAKEIDIDEVARLVSDENAQLVEVLGPKSFDELRLPDAVNIRLGELDARTAAVLDRARPVVVYCYDHQ